jgi:hypothetical protein
MALALPRSRIPCLSLSLTTLSPTALPPLPRITHHQVQQYLGPEAVRTGGAALRRLGLANTRVSLVSLHDLAGYCEAIVRVAVTLEGTHRPNPAPTIAFLVSPSAVSVQSPAQPLSCPHLVTSLPYPTLP